MLKLLSLFSGIGAPEQALKNIGIEYKLIGYSEIDKYAIKSYCSIHGATEKDNLGDITKIDINNLPLDIDLITHGSPCQDFSVAGNNKGGDKGTGTRSSLMWNTVDIVRHCKPKYVLWENVKNLLSKKHKHNFDAYIEIMDQLGYNSYYKILNAKNFGVPQNRERVFTISIRKDIDNNTFKFPNQLNSNIHLKDILENNIDGNYYINSEKAEKLISEFKYKDQYTNSEDIVCPCLTPDRLNKRQNGRRFKENGEPMFTITSQDKHGILENNNMQLKDILEDEDKIEEKYYLDDNTVQKLLYKAKNNKYSNKRINYQPTLSARDYKDPKCLVTTPKIKVKVANKTGFQTADIGDSINIQFPNSKTRRGRVGYKVAQTLETSCNQATLTQDYRIRKLTPREYWRLMGFSDKEFNKAAEVCSNSQLYKQAGNSIVVTVLEKIFINLLNIDSI